MNTKKLLRALANYYPKRIAKKYHDHVGHMTGVLKEDTSRILLCLDFDEEVYNYMEKNNLFDKIDLIMTHHPFIYGTKARVFKYDQNKEALCNKIDAKNIPIYSFHTNFDEGKDGMNDALAKRLNLKDIKPLEKVPMARGGYLEKEMTCEEFAKYANKQLEVDYSLLLNYGKKNVKSVAIVGGGGWGHYRDAQDENYDIYISGDMPHHGRRGVVSYKCNYLDMPHEIEKIFIHAMEAKLLEICPKLQIIKVDHEKLPKVIN
ncbi:MAG: Nif3-like dinuclear metal center hexameric protein [Bacilli bacterium]|nr:Nif3-like dinuclear metal center hexameric protein [Bacilli bacterium]